MEQPDKSKGIKKPILLVVGLMLIAILSVIGVTSLTSDTEFVTPILSIKSSADDQPVITFDQNSIKYSLHPFMVLYVSEVQRSGKDFTFRPVWKLVQDKDKWETPVSSFTYGTCPPGFQELSAPEPLVDGHYYLVGRSPNVFKQVSKGKFEVVSLDKVNIEVLPAGEEN